MKDISNRTEQNEEYVKQVCDSVETWMRKATEMEEERDSHRERCANLEKENRMLRNGERFKLLREKMIVREKIEGTTGGSAAIGGGFAVRRYRKGRRVNSKSRREKSKIGVTYTRHNVILYRTGGNLKLLL